MRVSLIIPVLNEAECIGPLLAEVMADPPHQVIVVDNGSTDETGHIARQAGALVIQEPRRGYGYACAAGAANAEGEILVFMDGDGSFVPGEYRALIAPIERREADLVLGSRILGDLGPGAMPLHQHYGNMLVVWLVRKLYGIHLTDLGPFRAIRKELLSSLDMQEKTYGWPVEMIVKTARSHRPILETPVTYRPRFAGRSKVGGTLRGSILAAYRFFRVVSRYAIE